MKKLFKLLPLLLLPLFFTSCIDYVQSITYKDGKYNLYYKVTVSKMLFALAQQDPDALFEELNDITSEEIQDGFKASRINDEYEVGLEMALKVDPKEPDEFKLLLPTKAENKYYIPTLFCISGTNPAEFNAPTDNRTEAISTAILSSAKLRVMVSKKIVPSVTSAYLEGASESTDSLPISFYDFGDSYCFEIPFVVVYKYDEFNIGRIVCID